MGLSGLRDGSYYSGRGKKGSNNELYIEKKLEKRMYVDAQFNREYRQTFDAELYQI
jgi:hypothetical protein